MLIEDRPATVFLCMSTTIVPPPNPNHDPFNRMCNLLLCVLQFYSTAEYFHNEAIQLL